MSSLIVWLMSFDFTSNPGVGLKLTAPRIHDRTFSSDTPGPGPQSYSISGMSDLTERERIQNELLSKRSQLLDRFGLPSEKNFPPNETPAATTMQPICDLKITSASPSTPISTGQKRAREQDAAPSEYYSIPGMSDLTEREMNQNEFHSKRYHGKER
mmetsp:Transcript_8476/g.20738  ORF Transcript_8476/g.20738 Transcript_8476/m.20738 type:complete len:157 (-) Transcript_8476:1364-1834(-)